MAGVGDGAVRDGVDAPAEQLPADVRVPVVLDLVVRPPRQPRRDQRPLVAEEAVELDDEVVLVGGEVAALEVGAEVVDPAEAAALAAAEEAGGLGQRAPAAFAVRADVDDQALVLFLGPRALVGVRLLAARRPPHPRSILLLALLSILRSESQQSQELSEQQRKEQQEQKRDKEKGKKQE